MKKNKTYELYQLIGSLSAAEKKFIRRSLQKYDTEHNKALVLFDNFNTSYQPEDKDLEKSYAAKKYNFKYLSADKNKLYEDILFALAIHSDEYSNEVRTNNALQKAIVLYEKKLFEQCLKQIIKSKKQADEFELWGLLISLLHLEQRCFRVLFDFDSAEAAMLEEKTVFNKQDRLNRFANFHYKSIALRIRFSKARSGEQIEAFNGLISELEKLGKGPDFYTEFNCLETYCNYYYVKDDLLNEMRSNQELSSLMQQYPWYIEDNPLNYIAIRTRLLGIQRRTDSEIFWKELPLFRQLPIAINKQKLAATVNVFIFSYNYELDQLLLEKRWTEAFALIEPMENGIQKFRAQIDSNWLYAAYFRFTAAAVYSANYQSALDFILELFEAFPASLRPDLYKVSLLLQIVVHYELGNFRLIPSLVSNARYYLKKEAQLFGTEKILLSTIKKLSDTKLTDYEKSVTFEKLTLELSKLRINNFEKKIFEAFDFLLWAERKQLEFSSY